MVTKSPILVLAICSSLAWLTPRHAAGVVEDRKTTPNDRAVLQYLRDVAWSSRKAIRIYYQAECQLGNAAVVDDDVPFPTLEVRRPARPNGGIAAVREIFSAAKQVKVEEQPAGVIRIWIGQVPMRILQTRLSSVTFSKDQAYDPSLAIGAIEGAKEMHAAETALGVSSVLNVGGLVAPTGNPLPRLPPAIRNVTVDQALDLVAKTWGGPLLYGACSAASGQNSSKLFAIWYGGYVLGRRFD